MQVKGFFYYCWDFTKNVLINFPNTSNWVTTNCPATGNVGDGAPASATDWTPAATIEALTVTICERAAAHVFKPILDGGDIAPDGVKVVWIIVIFVVAKVKLAITGAIPPN